MDVCHGVVAGRVLGAVAITQEPTKPNRATDAGNGQRIRGARSFGRARTEPAERCLRGAVCCAAVRRAPQKPFAGREPKALSARPTGAHQQRRGVRWHGHRTRPNLRMGSSCPAAAGSAFAGCHLSAALGASGSRLDTNPENSSARASEPRTARCRSQPALLRWDPGAVLA